MKSRDGIGGRMRFGGGVRTGGIPISIDTDGTSLPDKGRSTLGEIVTGPNGETLNTRPDKFHIQITGGGTDGKYSWKRVYPGSGSDEITDAVNGEGTYDGFYAYEINGSEDVADDTIVEATYSDLGPWLNFTTGGGGGGGGETGRWVRITEASSSGAGGTWKGVVYDKDGSGGYTDGESVRITFTPNGGEIFLNGRDQWATLNGTVNDSGTPRAVTDGVTTKSSTTVTSATASFTSADVGATITGTGIPGGTTITVIGSSTSVTLSAAATATGTGISFTITPVVAYPKYHAIGNDKVIVPVCRAGVEECDLWILPAPVDVIENVDCDTGEPL